MPSSTTLLTSSPLRLISLALTLVSITTPVQATPCLAFDANFNLLALGLGGKDFNLGTQDKWSSTVSPVDITSPGRPPFDGKQTTCYLAQFFNAIYVLDGDSSDPTAVHIYDAAAKSWTKQEVNTGGPNPETLTTILDHDTNVFYALDGNELSFLDMGEQKSANSTALSWVQVGNPSFDTTGYKPTMALAENHVHFIGVPNAAAGDAFIFVIHFSFFQPEVQSYPTIGGGSNFPSTHGQAASFFLASGAQTQFAFIPDDGSATYVIDVTTNNTLPLAGPSDKSASTYAASLTSLVQLTSAGEIFFLPYTPGTSNNAQNQAASWSKITATGLPLPNSTVTNGTTTGSSTGGTGSGTGSNGSGTGTASGSSPSGSTAGSGGKSGAVTVNVGMGMVTLFGSLLLGALVM